jgi:hypothetical protein
MALCVNCGVELDDGMKICPLCGRYQGNGGEQKNLSPDNPSGIIQVQKKENTRYLWELSGIITFSGIAVCTIVELLISKGLRWSLFSDVSIVAAWLVLTLFLYGRKRPLIVIPGLMVTILAALFVINLIAPGRSWFIPVALPLVIAAFLAGGIVILLYRVAHFKGFNVIALALIVLSGFCIVTEMILDNYLKGFVDLRWSLITSVSILPVALILFFYHYRLKKGNRLDSFFHV